MAHSELNIDFTGENSAWVNEKFDPKSEIDFHSEEIRRNGFSVLENRLNTLDVDRAKQRIDEIYDMQVQELGGEDLITEIGEQGLARNLIQYDDFFMKIVLHEDVLTIMKYFMGDYFSLFQFNGNLNIPKIPATSTPWHRDLTFRHFTSSRPISMTALWVLDDFNETNDGISILSGSHLHEVFPSYRYIERHKQKVFAKAGSVIILDGMMFHRSGFNKSDHRRRVCQGMYSLPFMLQQINIPRNIPSGLAEKYCKDPKIKHILGYNNMQSGSVLNWRKEKLENKRKNLSKEMVAY